MNKKISFLLPLVACALAGCGPKEDTSNTLTIGCVKMGYGVKWLENLVSAYQTKTGNKIILKSEVGQTGMTKLNTAVDAGDSTYDLIFNKRNNFAHDCLVGKVAFDNGVVYDSMYVDISDVYNAVVDNGSTKTIKQKMTSNYSNFYEYNGHYYGMPWANGIVGIVRNKTQWDAFQFQDKDIPLTTNQLFKICDKINDIKSTTTTFYPFMYCSADEYYTGWCNIFLAQYKGAEEFENTILEGKGVEGVVDNSFFKHDGMIETLEVMEQLLTPSNNYQHPSSKELSFTQVQTQFLSGAAMFNVNGSWLETEMGTNSNYNEIDYIKTPIISSIVNRLSFGDDNTKTADQKDNLLAQIIKYVDGSIQTAPSGVTGDDIEIVRSAREASFVESGLDHQCFIPCAAKHVDQAKDFLKFMYSDEGLNVYYEAMNGGTLPAIPTSGSYNKTLNLSTFRASINKYISENQIERMVSKAKFFNLGDLNHWYSNHGIKAISRLADGGTNNTPAKILAENDDYLVNNWSKIAPKVL